MSYRRAATAAVAVALCVLGVPAAQSLAATPQLPNLVPDAPDGVRLEVTSLEGKKVELLRFNGYIHNKGPGALDFRGSRSSAKEPMHATQRVYNSDNTFTEEPSSAELVYATADGHEHFHLQHAAKYSLWNSAKTGEVAPAMKVGFCLDDSEHVESGVGPSEGVYTDKNGRKFCDQHEPEALSLFEGISPGWRDRYESGLTFQWVDVSEVLPGRYELRSDVNPTGVIKEVGGANEPAYTEVTLPGFVAQAQSVSTGSGEPLPITLTAKAYKDESKPKYAIVKGPAHGSLSGSGGQLTYTPAAGFSGSDSFTFSAADEHSEFPRHPAIATVSIRVEPRTGGMKLLVGDATGSYTVPDQASAGHEESFLYTAKATGTVEELEFLTGQAANAGVEGVVLALFADAEGHPGAVLGSVSVPGEPPPSTWVRGTGVSIPVTVGSRYWLVVLPLGKPGSQLSFNAASPLNKGEPNLESVAEGLQAATPETAWNEYDQGPVGFQGIGSPPPPPSIGISGEQQEMIAGTSVALTATVANDSGGVVWEDSAGTITPEGAGSRQALYLAPASPGTVTITARLSDRPEVSSQVSIRIAPVPAQLPAPSVPTPGPETTTGSLTGSGGSANFQVSQPVPKVDRPRVMLFRRQLIMTTTTTVAGRVRLSAYVGRHRLGSCSSSTPGDIPFTCRLTLSRGELHARIEVIASLRAGSLLLSSTLGARRIPEMKMKPLGLLAHSAWAGSRYYWCSPVTLVPTLEVSKR